MRNLEALFLESEDADMFKNHVCFEDVIETRLLQAFIENNEDYSFYRERAVAYYLPDEAAIRIHHYSNWNEEEVHDVVVESASSEEEAEKLFDSFIDLRDRYQREELDGYILRQVDIGGIDFDDPEWDWGGSATIPDDAEIGW
jgi:prolyl-tRNA synthetase